MRNPAEETDLGREKNISLLALDVTNFEQINDNIAHLLKTTSVDFVFNNAGYSLAGLFEGATDEPDSPGDQYQSFVRASGHKGIQWPFPGKRLRDDH